MTISADCFDTPENFPIPISAPQEFKDRFREMAPADLHLPFSDEDPLWDLYWILGNPPSTWPSAASE